MANIFDGTTTREVHCSGAAPEAITSSLVLDWATVTGGNNSLSRYLELDARTASVSVRIPAAPGAAHNGKKILININRDDASTANFRGVLFTGGNPVERGALAVRGTYALDRRAGHLALEVVNGVVRIVSGGSFNTDPTLPPNADLLALLNSWTTGATWAAAPDNASDAFVQFNANGVFNPARAINAWLLSAAGGGGGGGTVAGGGGAGEFFEDTTFAITAISHAITIGAGGVGGLGWSNTGVTGHGTDGADTSFGALFTLNGGGGGGQHETTPLNGFENGNAGGSGGGGGQGVGTGGASVLTGPTGQTPGRFGNAGGTAILQVGGGGGGAGGIGETATSNNAGDGGAGRTSLITGVSVHFCGGGGGGNRNDITAGGPTGAGSASGGRGGMDTLTPVAHDGVGAQSTAGVAAMNGRANSGGGGGGGGYSGGSNATIGATGGSGVLILRVPLVSAIGL